MIIHAYHGWASDASVWDKVMVTIGSGVTFRSYDRGYFGPEHGVPHNEPADVILTHSMGLLFVPDAALAVAKRFVVVNGFSFFPSSDPITQRRTLSMLSLMKSNLERNPVDQVNAFCIKAGMKLPAAYAKGMNVSRLTADLDMLATARVDIGRLRAGATVRFIHATADPIVSKSATSDTLVDFPDAEHHTVESQSHNLPEDEAGLIRTLIFGT